MNSLLEIIVRNIVLGISMVQYYPTIYQAIIYFRFSLAVIAQHACTCSDKVD